MVEADAGRAVQLQSGVDATESDVVLFLHADTRLPGGFAAAVEAALGDPAVVGGAFQFAFEGEAHGWRLRLVEWGARWRVRLFSLPYGDQGLFVRRSVLEAIGGIAQVPIMEDLDLVSAMRQRGRLALLPLPARTSPRRYERAGPLWTMALHWFAAACWLLDLDRARVAAWVRG